MSDFDAGNADGTPEFIGADGRTISGLNIVDPTNGRYIGGGSGDIGSTGTGKRGRGRPLGSGAGASTKKDDTSDLKTVDIKDILMSIHTMLAIRLSCPQLELTEAEAKKMDTAVKRVMKHHPLSISQKHVDYATLLYVIADVYGTRAVSIYMARNAATPTGSSPVAGSETGPAAKLFTFPGTA